MILAMPDKSVRVTSRFPNGHSTIYFDLDRLGGAHGFMLEQDQRCPETFVLRLVGGYSDSAARYGDLSEAEADFTDLTTMLADRHHLPVTASRSTAFGAAKRKGWGWKGMAAGLALGAVGTHFATGWRTADTSAIHAAGLGDAVPRLEPRGDGDFIPAHGSSSPPRLAALPPVPAAPATPQSPLRAPAPAPNFGLQP